MTANILIVEDDPIPATLYEHMLTKSGWRVIHAPTLAEATDLLAKEQIALVLLDLFLPDGDGRTWLATLRALPDHGATPVIVVAGSPVLEAQIDVYELGADTILAKPVAAEVLVAAVRGALQRSMRRNRGRTPAAVPAVTEEQHVLLAEDDDVVAALVQHRLAREKFTVTRVTDGTAAYEVATTQPLVLAVLDIMMPGLDGFELLARLRGTPATKRLPILMLTGLGGERDVERALALGADDYMLKPFSPVELTARVQRLLRSR